MPELDPGRERSPWPAFALLATGIVAGHVAWFLLSSPDPWIVGLGNLRELGAPRAGVAGLLIAFEIAALLLFLRTVRASQAWLLQSPAGRVALFGACAVNVVTATAVTSRPLDYPLHLVLTAVVVSAAWLAVTAASVQAGRGGFDSAIERSLESPKTARYLALFAAVGAAAINRVVFDGIPHIPDEVVYLLQAKYLAHGSLYVTGVPAGALDVVSTVTLDGRWFGIFPVGWPALLAIGVRLGVPWLVNPVLTALLVLVANGVVRRLWGRPTANLAAFLIATSPWVLFLGSSFMAHTAAIVAGTTALRGAVEVAMEDRPNRWSWLGGAALGMLVLIRPFEGVLIGIACAGIVAAKHRSVVPGPGAVSFALPALAIGALTLPYNRALTGRALLNPITYYFDTQYYPGSNRLGFGADVGNVGWGNDALPGHSVFEALINASWNGFLVQVELFGWAFGSAALLLLALAITSNRLDGAMKGALAVVTTVLVGYAFYWYSAADFGARYWSQIIVPMAGLTAASVSILPRSMEFRRIVILASLLGMPVVVTMRGALKYHSYRGMSDYMEEIATSQGFGEDLILIRGDVFSDYSPGLILDSPGFEGSGPLYFRWVDGPELAELRARFPSRRLWVVDGPSITDGHPRVVSGPIS